MQQAPGDRGGLASALYVRVCVSLSRRRLSDQVYVAALASALGENGGDGRNPRFWSEPGPKLGRTCSDGVGSVGAA